MNKSPVKISRRQQILAALANMLEILPGERITTALLAKEVGVSEAALYRHFPSKTKMYEGLIEYIEESIFSRITEILAEEKSSPQCCEHIITALLTFAEKNPGLARLFVGDALTGETARLRVRMAQFFNRFTLQIKQILHEHTDQDNLQQQVTAQLHAHLLLAYVDGCITQFVRSEFQQTPSLYWQDQWPILRTVIFPANPQAHY